MPRRSAAESPDQLVPPSRFNRPAFSSVTIIGVGLIGGSLGLAIKRRFPLVRVLGVDRPSVLRKAQTRKAIDHGTSDLRGAVEESDLVVLATPLKRIITLLPGIARYAGPETVVTDVGSVKSRVMQEAVRRFRRGNFVGGHPMAGVELSGIEAAHPLLFENAVYVLTPSPSTTQGTMRRLSRFLADLGARPFRMDARTHDAVAAAVSHLPQLIAVALMNAAGKKHRLARKYLRLAAGGFRDLTRIASSRFHLWEQILLLNRKEVAVSLDLFQRELDRYVAMITRGGVSLLRKDFDSSRRMRESIPKDMKGFLHRLETVQVFVHDRPGMLAKLTSTLAKKRINIRDLELMKVREGIGGTFRISFDSREHAAQAKKLLKKGGFEVAL